MSECGECLENEAGADGMCDDCRPDPEPAHDIRLASALLWVDYFIENGDLATAKGVLEIWKPIARKEVGDQRILPND